MLRTIVPDSLSAGLSDSNPVGEMCNRPGRCSCQLLVMPPKAALCANIDETALCRIVYDD